MTILPWQPVSSLDTTVSSSRLLAWIDLSSSLEPFELKDLLHIHVLHLSMLLCSENC